jgi:phage protein U
MSIIGNALGSLVDYATGYMPMMMLGSYTFSINTAAYQSLNRTTEYRWKAVPRFGQDDSRQFTGPGDDKATLEGVVYPMYRGGGGQVNKLRALATLGQPQVLVDGMGNVYGRWVIERVTEKQTEFAALGQPKKQEFSVELVRYDGGPSNLLVSVLSALNPGGLVTSAQTAISSAQSAVSGAVSSAGSSISNLF